MAAGKGRRGDVESALAGGGSGNTARNESDTGNKMRSILLWENDLKIIDRTQVVDTVLNRSAMMRNGGMGHQIGTMFLAEPTHWTTTRYSQAMRR